MPRPRLMVLLAALLGPGSLGCHDFVDPELGACGNRIVEAAEDCDDPSDPSCGPDCRLLCDPLAEDPGCPQLRWCGSDGICRAPSGRFSLDPIVIDEEGARWIEVGDFDGDRREDLVMQFDEPDLKLVYFDLPTAPEAIDFIEPITSRVGVTDLGGDGRDDLFIAPEIADLQQTEPLSVWRGTAERTLRPGHFATLRTTGPDARLLTATPVPDRILELVDATTTRTWSSRDAEAVDVSPVGLGGAELGRAIAVGDLDGGQCEGGPDRAPFPRAEVVLGRIGDPSVWIGSTCGDATGIELRSEVVLPAAAVLGEAGTFLVDASEDGILDLLVQGADDRVHVAYGVGDGSFHSTPEVPAADGDDRFAAAPLLASPSGALGPLLAAADLDDDGLVELVSRDYYVAAPEDCDLGACALEPWPRPLHYAAVVDINDDGAIDLVSLDDDILGVRLGDPLREVTFEVHEQELLGEARALVVGDFDRDTVYDVAFIEQCDDELGGTDEELTILYGGPVDAWRFDHFGPFGEVRDLAVDQGATLVARIRDDAGQISGAFVRPDDPWHDFGLAVRGPVAVSVAGQAMIASVVARPGDDTESLGHFGFLGGGLSPHDIRLGDSLGLEPGAGLHTLSIAIDLDAEGTDELVVLGTRSGRGAIWLARLDAELRWRIDDTFEVGPGFARRLVDPDLDQERPRPGGGPGSAAAVADVDGDGDPDIVATTDEPLPRVLVLRNDAGRIAAQAVLVLTNVTNPAFEIAAIEPWHRGESDTPRWLVAGEDGVALAELDLAAAELRLSERFELRTAAIAAADLDGNGLLDLVVATPDQVRIHLAEETIGASGPE